MDKPKLLYIDDETDNLDALERLLRRKFEIFKAAIPQEAFNHLDQHPDIAIIISDQRMPLITGVEFLEKSIDTHPDSIRILLTGYTDIESVIEAVNKGQIYKYITKPWDPVDLLKSLENAYEKFSLRKELKSKNQALEKALIDLQSLDKTKSQFMILINHELKTPLTSILSFAGLLKETSLTDEQNLFTDRILKSSEKLKNIIDDVLLIVKGELGQINLNTTTINLENCLSYINEDIQLMIGAKTQSLSLHLNATSITADSNYFRMILNRALHNATKFGLPDSDLKITSYKIGQRTLLEVQNKGPHISKAILDKILKPFTLDENVMNHSVGMGLGLTICQTVLKAHNGHLEIENNDQGVTVRFIFS